jgi:hypothetical protein
MESSTCDFEFKNISISLETFDVNRTLLWILHADKIPPHIGISSYGSYFSLKVNGKDEDLPVKKLLALIQNKKMSVVIIQLLNTLSLDDLKEKFNNFQKAEDLTTTCLTPIKELLTYETNVLKLKDLLETLHENGEIKEVFGLNLKKTFKGIPFYTTEQIQKRLELLKHAER